MYGSGHQRTAVTPEALSVSYPLLRGKHLESDDHPGPEVWSALIHMTAIWGQARRYVSECAEGRNTSPWSPESTYTLICSMILDIECSLQSSIRYDNCRFSERSIAEIQGKRQYWVIWIQLQILYHAIHSTLNHPFIYSQRASRHKKGPNVFWRISSELAILHSTWITRLIDMACKKELEIFSPLMAQCTAIAATLNFYHSRAADSSINSGTLANLDKCRSFIRQLESRWPACKSMVSHHPKSQALKPETLIIFRVKR